MEHRLRKYGNAWNTGFRRTVAHGSQAEEGQYHMEQKLKKGSKTLITGRKVELHMEHRLQNDRNAWMTGWRRTVLFGTKTEEVH